MNRQTIVVTHLSIEKYIHEWPSKNAEEFIQFFQDKLGEIPEEYRERATIELTCEDNYDGYAERINIRYQRPENDYEMEIRISRETDRHESLKSRELKELKRLQDKYGVCDES